jgi:hypothetical protein
MTRQHARPRRPFTVHIPTETLRSRGPLDAGPLCQQPPRAVMAAEHPGRSVLVCPDCADRWRAVMRETTTRR